MTPQNFEKLLARHAIQNERFVIGKPFEFQVEAKTNPNNTLKKTFHLYIF